MWDTFVDEKDKIGYSFEGKRHSCERKRTLLCGKKNTHGGVCGWGWGQFVIDPDPVDSIAVALYKHCIIHSQSIVLHYTLSCRLFCIIYILFLSLSLSLADGCDQ